MSTLRKLLILTLLLIPALCTVQSVRGDGKIIRPRNYTGSLEEKAQEAIIIFREGKSDDDAVEDLILKIRVEGAVGQFAWVIPFPNPPKVKKEDPALFRELFQYVEARKARSGKTESAPSNGLKKDGAEQKSGVKIIERKTVGDFEIATVREEKEGGLNPWLEKEGFQKLEDAEDVIGFYRKKNYVFCCIKVSAEALESEKKIDSHPLRFTFKTGGKDGIYFPMKMTGLQESKFDLNLYVFYRYWLNDKLNRFGYLNRGLRLNFRDYDSTACEPNGGKSYSLPGTDPYLKNHARRLTTVSRLFQKLHPGKRFYLTNIKANGLKPEDVREWSDDLWMFPYYTNTEMVPYDVRNNGPASAAWPDEDASIEPDAAAWNGSWISKRYQMTGIALIGVAFIVFYFIRSGCCGGCCSSKSRNDDSGKPNDLVQFGE